MINSTLDLLIARGMIAQISNEAILRKLLNGKGVSIYTGFDPSASSLHVGSLLPIMVLANLQKAGHRPIALVGGATGMIGDPSGRDTERLLQTTEVIDAYKNGIRHQLEHFLSFEGSNAAIILDNSDWIAPFSYLDWLRDVGKHFTVNYMVAKESVRRRLEDREHGISYTEFSYMLLQSYDFVHIHKNYDCLVQAGGSDQWGNITAGIDLVRRMCGTEVYGMTCPLITTASGEKFGKSAGNAIWLAPDQTSPYQFYQYWIQTDDNNVEQYLKFFTFLALEDIQAICEAHKQTPEKREAQRILAAEITRLVHGESALQKALQASEILFGHEISGLTDKELKDIFADVPSTQMAASLLSEGLKLVDLLSETKLCASKGDARRLVQSGGVYVNNRREVDPNAILNTSHLASETMLVLRTGKKKYHLVHSNPMLLVKIEVNRKF